MSIENKPDINQPKNVSDAESEAETAKIKAFSISTDRGCAIAAGLAATAVLYKSVQYVTDGQISIRRAIQIFKEVLP
jgi:hypothetical protein